MNIKEMVSAVVTGKESLNPIRIAKKINERYKANVTEKNVNDFLQSEFYPKIEHIVNRHKREDDQFYM